MSAIIEIMVRIQGICTEYGKSEKEKKKGSFDVSFM